MPENRNVGGLIGLDLAGFKLIMATEVYSTSMDELARKVKSIGYYRDSNVAAAIKGELPEAAYRASSVVFVLVNESTGEAYALDGITSITLVADEQALLEVRNQALSKLTAAERAVLGL